MTMTTVGKLFRKCITRALVEYELPRSESAIRLLCMIAAHESGGFKYCRQISGPAIGLLQMEPATFDDVSDYARKKGYCLMQLPTKPEEMIFDTQFAIAMARIFFLRKPELLPYEDDLMGLAQYAKKYWNTSEGKATPEVYLSAYQKYFTHNKN